MKKRGVAGSDPSVRADDSALATVTPVDYRCPRDWRHRWGVILAGGDGTRLQALTQIVCGDDRPKQFCPLVGEGTLLKQTMRRAEQAIFPDQTVIALTRSHRDYFMDLENQPSQRIVQPCNKGTAPAILYSLLHIEQRDRDAIVAILPSDHFYSPESGFTDILESAFEVAQSRPQSVVLLGAQPSGPEVEYGWIELGPSAGSNACPEIFHVSGFREKPSLRVAEHLLRSGSLWNTFVMVGHVHAFLDLAREFAPYLQESFESEPMSAPRGGEVRIPDRLYDRIAPVDFSRQILSPAANQLVTLPLGSVEWNDLGDPDRVFATLRAINAPLPRWAVCWRKAAQEQATHPHHLTAIA